MRLPFFNGRSRGFVVLATLGLAFAALLLAAVLALGAAFAWYASDLPPLTKATDYRPQQHLQVYTSDGVEIAQFGTERRVFVPIAQVPKALRDAVIATEDAGFYEHPGISVRGLARAMWANATGGVPQGASTITQQVARTFFLSTRRTPERKIKEAMLALQLERKLSKDQILELYMNQIYLGQRAYGFGAAALAYFGKTLSQLDLAESAMLAGLPQNPIHANPISSPERAARRQQWVLQRLVKTGAITEEQRAAAAATKLTLRGPNVVDIHAEYVAEMARRAVVERLGDKAYTEGIRVTTTIVADEQRAAHAALRKAVMAHERKQPWRGPEDHERLPDAGVDDGAAADRAAALALKDQRDDEDLRVAIVLSASPKEITAKLASGETVTIKPEGIRVVSGAMAALSPKAPDALAIDRGAIVRVVAVPRPKDKSGAVDWQLAQWPGAEAAFVALDPVTGRVRSLVGGFDFNRQPFNHVTSAWRQPGSSFKPFLYSAALEQGVTPQTLIDDAPLPGLPDGTPPNWNPKNSDGKFDGEITLREALVRSKNLVSIRVLEQIGVSSAREWAARFGFDPARQPENLTLALGTGSVTPMQLAQAYAVFANGGYRVQPVLIERIANSQGEVLFEAPPPAPMSDADRAIPPRNAFVIDSLLADVTLRGTAARAQATLKRPDVYGKTGTTNDAVDAWFGGFAPGVAAVAWMGYDDPESLGDNESGGGLALPIWIDYMARALKGVPLQRLRPPEGVIEENGDWRYAEWAGGGGVGRIGPPPGVAPVASAASEPAASAPAR